MPDASRITVSADGRLMVPDLPLSRSSKVTYDLARQMEGAKEVSCSTFAEKVVESMK